MGTWEEERGGVKGRKRRGRKGKETITMATKKSISILKNDSEVDDARHCG